MIFYKQLEDQAGIQVPFKCQMGRFYQTIVYFTHPKDSIESNHVHGAAWQRSMLLHHL